MTRSSLLSAKRLIEPDVWTCPHGKRVRPQTMETFGPEVAAVCADAGYAPDPQQELILDLVFAFRPDGSPASFETCIICTRQNLKTGALKQICLGWIYVLDEPEVVWSAHEMSTSMDAQDELHSLIKNAPALRKRMLVQKNEGLYTDNGSERIELRDPATGMEQTIRFKARTATGGRGLARRKLILDEAFALTARMLGSLLPIMLAMENAQVVSASSAGASDAVALADMRSRGTAGTTPMMTYVEWGSKRVECEDPDCVHPKNDDQACALNRPEVWIKANPAVSTGRITVERIANLRQALSAEEFMRECLGWWDEDDQQLGPPAIDLRAWKRRKAEKETPAPKKAAVVLDVEPDRSHASIGLVGATTGGRVLMMTDTKPGLAWVVPELKRLRERLEVVEVSLHPKTQAGSLIPALKKAKIPFEELVHQDLARGCAAVQIAVVDERLVHMAKPADPPTPLDGAAAIGRTRMVTESEIWDRRDTRHKLSPLVAGSTALHRWDVWEAQHKPPPPSPRRAGAAARAKKSSSKSVAQMGF